MQYIVQFNIVNVILVKDSNELYLPGGCCAKSSKWWPCALACPLTFWTQKSIGFNIVLSITILPGFKSLSLQFFVLSC